MTNDWLLTTENIGYDNLNFWYFHILSFRGFDDIRGLNLDEAIKEMVDAKKSLPSFDTWYEAFLPEDEADGDGFLENPKTVIVSLKGGMDLAVEFHLYETVFYLNDYYIGNLGGHFEAWFLTLKELLAFDEFEVLFLLLLPMAGIEEMERKYAETLVSEKLKSISIFSEHAEYLARCIVNGLVIEGTFSDTPGIGITSETLHCVRNVAWYPENTESVLELNKALASFVR